MAPAVKDVTPMQPANPEIVLDESITARQELVELVALRLKCEETRSNYAIDTFVYKCVGGALKTREGVYQFPEEYRMNNQEERIAMTDVKRMLRFPDVFNAICAFCSSESHRLVLQTGEHRLNGLTKNGLKVRYRYVNKQQRQRQRKPKSRPQRAVVST